MKLFTFLQFVARTLALVVSTTFCWACLEFESLIRLGRGRSKLNHKWVSRWSRINLWLFAIRVTARGPHVTDCGLYPSSARPGYVGPVLVMNHRSSIDIPALLSVTESHVISRHDLATWPLFGWSARRVGTIFVDRNSRKSGASVLREVDSALKSGEGVLMFPEGSSYPGDEVRPFRPGAFNAARRAGAQIIPFGIAYSDESAYYHKESFLTHLCRIGSLSNLRVAVEVGQLLETEGLTPVEVINQARQQVQKLVDQARTRLET